MVGEMCHRLQGISLMEGVCVGAVSVRDLSQVVVGDPTMPFVGRRGGDGGERRQGMHLFGEVEGEGVEALRLLLTCARMLEDTVRAVGVFVVGLSPLGRRSAGAHTEGDG